MASRTPSEGQGSQEAGSQPLSRATGQTGLSDPCQTGGPPTSTRLFLLWLFSSPKSSWDVPTLSESTPEGWQRHSPGISSAPLTGKQCGDGGALHFALLCGHQVFGRQVSRVRWAKAVSILRSYSHPAISGSGGSRRCVCPCPPDPGSALSLSR